MQRIVVIMQPKVIKMFLDCLLTKQRPFIFQPDLQRADWKTMQGLGFPK